MLERMTFHLDPIRMETDRYEDDTPIETPTTDKPANTVSSQLANGKHAPVLDIDFPIAVVPSSTPGHFHLYLDVEMDWDVYEDLIRALFAAGVLGSGYAQHSLGRRQTIVRMPWVNKIRPTKTAQPGDLLPSGVAADLF